MLLSWCYSVLDEILTDTWLSSINKVSSSPSPTTNNFGVLGNDFISFINFFLSYGWNSYPISDYVKQTMNLNSAVNVSSDKIILRVSPLKLRI